MITVSAAVMTMAIGAAPAFAQEPQPPPPQETQQNEMAATIQGELVSVDSKAKTIVVKSDGGDEATIRYNEATVVTGADDGVEGLANTPGTRVSVTVSGEGADRVATSIRILPKM
jgi:hypothetical protein